MGINLTSALWAFPVDIRGLEFRAISEMTPHDTPRRGNSRRAQADILKKGVYTGLNQARSMHRPVMLSMGHTGH